MENSKTSEQHKFVLNLLQRLDSKCSNRHAALQNISMYYAWEIEENSIKTMKNKIIAPTWNECIIKKHETLKTIPPIYVCINRINKKLVFKTNDGYKLEIQSPETVKLVGTTKELIDKTKKG